MKQVQLGGTGMFVSNVCLGMMSYSATDASESAWGSWTLDIDAAEAIVRSAVEGGITFFDTADIYSAGGSEVATGRLLPKFLRREEMVVATKVFGQITPGPNGERLSRKHVLDAIDGSLRRLGMDYVDLYQVHGWDAKTPIEETMRALDDVVRSGKARYLGACNLKAWQITKANAVARAQGGATFVSLQNHHNLLARDDEREALPMCVAEKVAYLSWSSLARGWLSGRYRRDGQREQSARSTGDAFATMLYGRSADYDVIERLISVADARGVPPVQVALAWLLQTSGVTAPIVGLSNTRHFADVAAAAELDLSSDEVATLEEAYQPRPAGAF